MSKTIYAEESVIIDRDVKEVYEYLKYTKNQNNFSVWNMKDPKQKTSEQGKDGEVGYVYTWNSEDPQVGAGSQKIKNLIADQEIQYEINFDKPMKSTAESFLKVDKAHENRTKVTWTFEAPVDESQLKVDVQELELNQAISKSLKNLKNVLEGL